MPNCHLLSSEGTNSSLLAANLEINKAISLNLLSEIKLLKNLISLLVGFGEKTSSDAKKSLILIVVSSISRSQTSP